MPEPEAPPAGSNMQEAHQEAAENKESARTAKRKAAIAREIAMMRPEFLVPIPGGRVWAFPPILPGDQAATVVYLDPAGARDEYSLSIADYRRFAAMMVDRLKAAGA